MSVHATSNNDTPSSPSLSTSHTAHSAEAAGASARFLPQARTRRDQLAAAKDESAESPRVDSVATMANGRLAAAELAA